MKKAFRAAAIAAILLFALTFIGNAKIKSASAHLLFSSSVSVGGNESWEVTLKSGDRIAIGSYLGEPIVWSVIETGGKTLLMSEKVLALGRSALLRTASAVPIISPLPCAHGSIRRADF